MIIVEEMGHKGRFAAKLDDPPDSLLAESSARKLGGNRCRVRRW